MNNDIEKDFNLGGSIERALSGDYELKVGEVLKEAWNHTIKNFLSFSPAIVALIAIQFAIFYIALKLQIGDPLAIIEAFASPDDFDPNIISAIMIANFSYEVVSAPIYAGISLMAMSHAAGLATKISSYHKRATVYYSCNSCHAIQLVTARHRGDDFAFPITLLIACVQQLNSVDL